MRCWRAETISCNKLKIKKTITTATTNHLLQTSSSLRGGGELSPQRWEEMVHPFTRNPHFQLCPAGAQWSQEDIHHCAYQGMEQTRKEKIINQFLISLKGSTWEYMNFLGAGFSNIFPSVNPSIRVNSWPLSRPWHVPAALWAIAGEHPEGSSRSVTRQMLLIFKESVHVVALIHFSGGAKGVRVLSWGWDGETPPDARLFLCHRHTQSTEKPSHWVFAY